MLILADPFISKGQCRVVRSMSANELMPRNSPTEVPSLPDKIIGDWMVFFFDP